MKENHSSMKKILTKDELFLFSVSDEDYDFVTQWEWSYRQGYIQRSIYSINGTVTLYLHKVIAERAGLDCSNEIDHIDRNRLNNQRNNLRSATPSQNTCNQGAKSNNKAGYKGVRFNRRNNKYRAVIHLGYFKTSKEAAKAYDNAARKYFGEFGYTNFKTQE
jgi:hypothetical protein